MRRPLALALALGLVALVLVLPRTRAARLGALSAHEPLAAGEPALADVVLDGPAARPGAADGVLVLRLGGVRVAAPGGADLALSGVARRAVVRGLRDRARERGLVLEVEGETAPTSEPGGAVFLVDVAEDELALEHLVDGAGGEPVRAAVPWRPASRTSLLPPLVAIALAIVLRRPLPALFAGVLVGAFLLRVRVADALVAVPLAFRDVVVELLWPELVDRERQYIVLFVLFMLAMVGVMTRSGGLRGLMDALSRLASDARRTQVATWLMGLVVFFDDYANTILVGSTMRPLTDRYRIAREKLAYIVDSTAAPVAGISIFSTWVAFEVSTFSAQLPAAGLSPDDGYAVFLQTLPYRFYCLLTLVFVGAIAFTRRDLGPMRRAEERATREGKVVADGAQPMVGTAGAELEPAPGTRGTAWTAALPVLAFLGVSLLEIARRGGAFALAPGELFTLEGVTQVLYDGSGSAPLMLGALAGLVLAVALARLARLGLGEAGRAAGRVVLSMGVAVLILYLAWMIGTVCAQLGTAPYLSALVGEAIDPRLLPALLFLIAGAVAFATGSSWSTMSILLPIVVGLSYDLGAATDLADGAVASGRLLMVMSIGAVLEGAIFGDHCSPISDTTVMSSIASASDHIDHVRTQAPYAVLTMSVAMLAGYLPATYLGLHPLVGLGLGAAVLVAIVLLRGRRPEAPGTVRPAG